MKDYKRLTKWKINKFSQKPEADLKDKHSEPIVAITRLAELEDKIENGELVDRNAYLDYLMAAKDTSALTDKEIEFFVKHNARVREDAMPKKSRLIDENAELRARLKKAVEVENKIQNGELVGAIWFKSWLNGQICCGRVIGYDDSVFVIESGDDLISAEKIYTSREQAEKDQNKNDDILPF